MNPTGKKFISLFLVLSLLSINCAYLNMSKERRGVELVVIKLDGRQIDGELVAVKKSSLLLADFPGVGVSVDVADIKKIRIVKKSKAKRCSVAGFLVGTVIGGVYGVKKVLREGEDISYFYIGGICGLMYGAIFGLVGTVIGSCIGSAVGIDEIIQIEGRSGQGIQKALDYLRGKARIRNYDK